MSRSPVGIGDCTTGHLKASRMAVRDAPANADITPIPNLQFVHRESSGRRSDESSLPETTTGFFCSKMVSNKEARIIPFARRPFSFLVNTECSPPDEHGQSNDRNDYCCK